VQAPWAAAAGALLFALHPVQVEPVAWATGLKDVLSGVLSIIALWQYIAFVQNANNDADEQRHPNWVWHYAIASAAFVLAMLAKPSAAMVPLAAALISLLLLRGAWRRIALSLFPWFLLAAACLLLTRLVQPMRNSAIAVANAGAFWQRPLIASDALAFYLYKMAIPWPLMPQYDHTPQTAIARGWIYWAWSVPAGVGLLVLLLRKRAPWGLAALALLVAGILPVSGLAPFAFEGRSLVADRYLYLAMIGPAVALAFALSQTRQRLPLILVTLWLMVLGVLTFIQSTHWQNTRTLFEYELAVNPNSNLAYDNLASYYNFRGSAEDQEKALGYARTLVEKFPELADGYSIEGPTLAALGRTDEAIVALRQALKMEPGNIITMGNLASVLAQKGQLDEAMRISREIIAVAPQDGDAHRNYGGMLYMSHRDNEATVEFEAAIADNADDYQAHVALARLLAEKGQTPQAIDHYRAALSINPQYTPALEGLARLGGI
jgi:protein O-mannosyl-transferase